MSACRFEGLDPISADFAAFLAHRRPVWLDSAKAVDADWRKSRFLEVTLNGEGPMGALVLSTDADEVTIYADCHHSHSDWASDDESRQMLIDYVEDLIADRVVIASIWKGDRLRISWSCERARIDRFLQIPAGDKQLRIRSWSGKTDLTRPISWRGYLEALK